MYRAGEMRRMEDELESKSDNRLVASRSEVFRNIKIKIMMREEELSVPYRYLYRSSVPEIIGNVRERVSRVQIS
jgi:hypothetical protein